MWWIIGGAAAFIVLLAWSAVIVLLAWSAVIVGARADRDLEQWLDEKRREG